MKISIKLLKDILFPIYCVGCEAEGEWWCQNCQSQSLPALVLACPVCFAANADGQPCASCRASSSLDGIISIFPYAENVPIGKLIKTFKYNYAQDMVRLWENLITVKRERLITTLSAPDTSIIPVPLYSRRERERGFNQAVVLGKIFAEELQLSFISNSLKRARATAQQAKLSRPERYTNVASAFVWQGSAPPASIILVDDVYTTGATMQECARVLKLAGAKAVWGLTLARD